MKHHFNLHSEDSSTLQLSESIKYERSNNFVWVSGHNFLSVLKGYSREVSTEPEVYLMNARAPSALLPSALFKSNTTHLGAAYKSQLA